MECRLFGTQNTPPSEVFSLVTNSKEWYVLECTMENGNFSFRMSRLQFIDHDRGTWEGCLVLWSGLFEQMEDERG